MRQGRFKMEEIRNGSDQRNMRVTTAVASAQRADKNNIERLTYNFHSNLKSFTCFNLNI